MHRAMQFWITQGKEREIKHRVQWQSVPGQCRLDGCAMDRAELEKIQKLARFAQRPLGPVCIHLSQSMAETRKTKPMNPVRVFSQRKAMRRKRLIR